MKTSVRKNITDLQYSLHDMRVTSMKFSNDTLILEFPFGIVSIENPCRQTDGRAFVKFKNVDPDSSYVYVMNFCGNTGSFTGEKLPLKEFISDFSDKSFEVIDETYGYNLSKFSGFLSVDTDIKECVIEIYHLGNMEYIIEE